MKYASQNPDQKVKLVLLLLVTSILPAILVGIIGYSFLAASLETVSGEPEQSSGHRHTMFMVDIAPKDIVMATAGEPKAPGQNLMDNFILALLSTLLISAVIVYRLALGLANLLIARGHHTS